MAIQTFREQITVGIGGQLRFSPHMLELAGVHVGDNLVAIAVAKRCVAALANVAPRECIALYDAFHAGRHEEARALQLKLLPLNHAVTTRWSGSGLKAALDAWGDYYGGPPRLPLRPLGAEDRATLKQIMREAGVV